MNQFMEKVWEVVHEAELTLEALVEHQRELVERVEALEARLRRIERAGDP